MTELIYKLYDECLAFGMLPDQFWNCTHYDIIAYLQAKNKAKKEDLKEQTRILYNISLNIGSCFGGKTIAYEKLFPALSDPADTNKVQSWQTQKEIVKKFAEQYNARKKLEREARRDT